MSTLIKQLLVLTLLFITSTITSVASTIDTTKSVVKIKAYIQKGNYAQPWQSSKTTQTAGSGAIIKDNHILTAAHVINGAKIIEVFKENSSKSYNAKIKYISHQADLAILEVEDKSFFKGTNELKISEDINLQDKTTVIGYPIGGTNLSTTIGVVSRIDYIYYVHSANYLPVVQIDAPINSGNSGGPVTNNKNELIGIAMMTRKKGESIGYITPSFIINTFLKDIKDKKVDGFHTKGTTFEYSLINELIKEQNNITEDIGIVLYNLKEDEKNLKINDILLAIDGKDIGSDKKIKTQYGRIYYQYIYHTKQIGDTVTLDIIRDKKHIKLITKVSRLNSLINHEYGIKPKFIMYAGLVFTPYTLNYKNKISKYEEHTIDKKLYNKKITENYKEPIAMAYTNFSHKTNKGYDGYGKVLKSVNGINIIDFNHLVHLLDNNSDKYTTIEFLSGEKMIFDTKEAKDSFKNISMKYGVNKDRGI